MAGDYLTDFANANDKKDSTNSYSYQGNNGNSYSTNTEKMLFGNNENSNSNGGNSNSNVSQPKQSQQPNVSTGEMVNTGWKNSKGEVHQASVKPQTNYTPELGTYDENKYRHYKGRNGTDTGASAYAKDMQNYQKFQNMNNGDHLAAGHLGLVAEISHPDYVTGKGIVPKDYSQPQLSSREQSQQKMNDLKSRIKPFS
jgi:hypothetical protein